MAQSLSDARTLDNIKHFSAKTTKELRQMLAYMPSGDPAQRLVDERENIPAIHAIILGRGEEIEQQDFIVIARAIIALRVEGMAEDMAKPHFEELAREQGLEKRLRDAVENTDFFIDFDLTDNEVEDD